jgi:hypothetical protein
MPRVCTFYVPFGPEPDQWYEFDCSTVADDESDGYMIQNAYGVEFWVEPTWPTFEQVKKKVLEMMAESHGGKPPPE